MNVLMICNSEYQLMNGINIKYHMMQHDTVDIIVTIYRKWGKPHYSEEIARCLRETGLFRHVGYRVEDRPGFKKYWSNRERGIKEGPTLPEALMNTARNKLQNAIQKHTQGVHRFYKMLDADTPLDLKTYDRILTQINNAFINELYAQSKKEAWGTKWYVLDEGTGSYWFHDIGKKGTPADGKYLYAMELAQENENIKEQIRIPQLDPREHDFIQLLNRVFAYEPDDVDLNHAVILFDFESVVMPDYLKRHPILCKTLLRNTYKKHQRQKRLYEERLRLFGKIATALPESRIYVKFHPGTAPDRLHDYDAYENVRRVEGMDCPWELYACNHGMNHVALLSAYSSAVLLYDYVVHDEEDHVSVMFNGQDFFRARELRICPSNKWSESGMRQSRR